MRATVMYGAGDVRVEQVPDPVLAHPTDAIVRVVAACICGSDLWPYGAMAATEHGRRMGHEFLGVVEDVGADVATVGRGGAVGLCAVIAAKRLGAEQIILMGRHPGRTDLGRDLGATEVVPERGEEGLARVRELTGGDGTHAVLECVGSRAAIETAIGATRDGGRIGRVGAPQYEEIPFGFGPLMRNITLTGGVVPARAYIPQLLPDVLDGTIAPGRVFDRTVGLADVPDGYRAMAAREALKVLIRP